MIFYFDFSSLFVCLLLPVVAAFLISKHQMPGSALLLLSPLPASRFSFAIVGINITELQYRLMMKRKLRTHFYNLHSPQPSVDTYHEVYCKFPQEIQSTHKNHTNWKFMVVSITLTAVASMHSSQDVCGEFTIQHRYWLQMHSHISVMLSSSGTYHHVCSKYIIHKWSVNMCVRRGEQLWSHLW